MSIDMPRDDEHRATHELIETGLAMIEKGVPGIEPEQVHHWLLADAADKGAFISEDQMTAWFGSLGTDNELPEPEPDIFLSRP